MQHVLHTTIPTQVIGPIKIIAPEFTATVKVPLATFEAPLWLSVTRGAKVTQKAGGIRTVTISDCMTRSVLLQAKDANSAARIINDLHNRYEQLEQITAQSSRFTKLEDWQAQIVADLIYLRFVFTTGDAAGHNTTTKAAGLLQEWLLAQYPELTYVSISGNYCVDKKNSAVNGILGRGKYVIAESLIPGELCTKQLRATPEEIVALNNKKNLLGSIVSGGVRTANAHFANMLLAIYLATGQDAANIVEGSQGFTYAEVRNGALYFTVTLPSIIVGTVGSGKDFAFVRKNLELLGCLNTEGFNAQRFAAIIAAVVLCGELSLLAAQTNPDELMRCHLTVERKKS